MHNTFKKIIPESFSNLQGGWRLPIPEWDRPYSRHIILKTISTENNKRILKGVREKNQITYKSKLTKVTPGISTKIVKRRRA
jgi:hypothetical protein